jgi:hypothetical protein
MDSDTVDLHHDDLATTLLRERLLSEPRFKHSHLREINDESAPRTILPDTSLPVLDDLPKNIPPTSSKFPQEKDLDKGF